MLNFSAKVLLRDCIHKYEKMKWYTYSWRHKSNNQFNQPEDSISIKESNIFYIC